MGSLRRGNDSRELLPMDLFHNRRRSHGTFIPAQPFIEYKMDRTRASADSSLVLTGELPHETEHIPLLFWGARAFLNLF